MADYSTHARVVLSNSETLSNYIRKYSLSPVEMKQVTQQAGFAPLLLLTSKQINEALLNPQNALKNCIHAYATLISIHRYILTVQKQAHQQQLMLEQGMTAIRERYPRADPSQKETLANCMKELEQQYKEISAMHKQMTELETQLLAYEQELAKLTEQFDQQWDNYREHFLRELVVNLQNAGISLTELEQNELKLQDAWAAILKRFKDLSLEIPSYININKPTYTTYFELKSFLAIHASLSRRMLPHSAEDIANYENNK